MQFKTAEPAAQAFLKQNERTAADLTAEDINDVEFLAEHHAGGLYVLSVMLDDGRFVKMHDSWGDDEQVVVHVYDPEEVMDDAEEEHYFTSGHEALAKFKSIARES